VVAVAVAVAVALKAGLAEVRTDVVDERAADVVRADVTMEGGTMAEGLSGGTSGARGGDTRADEVAATAEVSMAADVSRTDDVSMVADVSTVEESTAAVAVASSVKLLARGGLATVWMW